MLVDLDDAVLSGARLRCRKIDTGLYETHLNFDYDLKVAGITFDPYPLRPLGMSLEDAKRIFLDETIPHDFGVCDHPQQLVEKYPLLTTDPRHFVVSLTEMRRADQPPHGGWRWHKWGPYIGVHDPQHEYLYDEDESIVSVWCYHIYEIVQSKV